MGLSPNWYGTGLIRDCSLYYWELEIVSNLGEIRKLIRRGHPHSGFESPWTHQTKNGMLSFKYDKYLKPKGTIMKYTDEELIIALQKEYEDTGTIPLSTKKRGIDSKTFLRRFGGWNASLVLAGIPIRKQKHAEKLGKSCPQCSNDFEIYKWQEKIFCSVQCSNAARRKKDWKPVKPRAEWLEDLRNKSLNDMLETPFDELGWDTKRRRVIYEQDNKCNKCAVEKWMEVPLSLEVDHIDGDHSNNNRENLEGLCPNCHSITPTWRGRNKACNKVSDEELTQALYEKDNIRQALLSVGMAAKGANYCRANRLLNGLEKYDRIN